MERKFGVGELQDEEFDNDEADPIINDHYSEKGGHKARSDYWRGIRKRKIVFDSNVMFPDSVGDHVKRRSMRRIPR